MEKSEVLTLASAKLSQFSQAILQFKGKPLSLKGYLPFREIYDVNPPLMTVRCSRQVG